MVTKLSELRQKISELAADVDRLSKTSGDEVRYEYNKWYGSALEIIKRVNKGILKEFENAHANNQKFLAQEDLYNDYLRKKHYLIFQDNLQIQKGLLHSTDGALEIKALDVTTLVTADLIENELDQAKLMLKQGFIRCAGALAGVTLESHLKLLHKQLGIQWDRGDGLNVLGQRLRKNSVDFTLGDEKKVIAMADTRNKCDHKDQDEPTIDEVIELIDDVGRFTQRVQVD